MILLGVGVSFISLTLIIFFILKISKKKPKTTKVDDDSDDEESGYVKSSYIHSPYKYTHDQHDHDLRQRLSNHQHHGQQYYTSVPVFPPPPPQPAHTTPTNNDASPLFSSANSPHPVAMYHAGHNYGHIKKITQNIMSPMLPILTDKKGTTAANTLPPLNTLPTASQVYKSSASRKTTYNSPLKSPSKSTKLYTFREPEVSPTCSGNADSNHERNLSNLSTARSPPESGTGTGEASPGLKHSIPLINLKFYTYNSDGTLASSSSTSTVQVTADKSCPQKLLQPQAKPVVETASAAVTARVPRGSEDEDLHQIEVSELSLERHIGGGGFGQVWLGKWRGTPVAVKVLTIFPASQSSADPGGKLHVVDEQTQKLLESFQDEIVMLSKLRHPNICLFMGASYDPVTNHRAIITEYVSRGSLWDALRVDRAVLFSDSVHASHIPSHQQQHQHKQSFDLFWPNWAIKKVVSGACMGLVYLHAHRPSPIIHRDLKSPNLLLTESYDIKICDFGLAKLRSVSVAAVMTSNVGTAQWMAPEVINGSAYNESADIYSLGLIIWELCTGRCPFEGLNSSQIAVSVVVKGLRPALPASLTGTQAALIQRCWHADPSQRPTARELLSELDVCFPL